MGKKINLTVLCWLCAAARSEEVKVVNISQNKDSLSAQSVKLYVPRIYATNSPYGHASPKYIDPINSGSQYVPVKEENLVIHKQNGFLKDSYGNRFLETPQSYAYKSTTPQQYLRIQDLPFHLSQPLIAAPGYPFKGPSHLSYSTPKRSSPFHPASPTPIVRFNGPYGPPQVYAEKAKYQHPFFSRQFHSKSNPPQPRFQNQNEYIKQKNTHYEPSHTEHQNHRPNHHQQGSTPQNKQNNANQSTHKEQVVAPAKQVFVTSFNGKKTTVTLDTKPPLPDVPLSFFEPLTFANPVVPQVQHFLPKITYKLPEVEAKNHQNEVIIQKTRSYDSGNVPEEPSDDEESEEVVEEVDEEEDEMIQQNHRPNNDEPPKTRNEKSNSKHEYSSEPKNSYEINTPKRKQTINEQVINYEKNSNSEPVHYSYDNKFENKPVSYSYTSKMQEPLKSIHFETHKNGPDSPEIVVYKTNQDSTNDDIDSSIHEKTNNEDSGDEEKEAKSQPKAKPYDGSHENDEEELPAYKLPVEHRQNYNKNDRQSFKPNENHPVLQKGIENYRDTHYQNEKLNSPTIKHFSDHGRQSSERHPARNEQSKYDSYPRSPPSQNIKKERIFKPSKPPVDPQSYERAPFKPSVQTLIPQSYEEDIRIVPSNTKLELQDEEVPQEPPKNKRYHQNSESEHPRESYHENSEESSAEEQVANMHQQSKPSQPYETFDGPTVIEKSRKIIIQEETPDEMHSLSEQMSAEVSDHENKKEEDFENAYKSAAIGFPSYEHDEEEVDKSIFSPESYGNPRDEDDFTNSPFQRYTVKEDDFPKNMRLQYKNDKDNMKEDYYLDYSLSKPTSYLDSHKKKIGYYKALKNDKPEYYYGGDKRKKMFEKLMVAPHYEYPQHEKKRQQAFYEGFNEPPKYSYSYAKEAPKDAFARASVPLSVRKVKTHFVEPQFQYGFEPISLPSLLDGELATMSSNHSPETDKSGTRKKIYKENWYIKKTDTSKKPTS